MRLKHALTIVVLLRFLHRSYHRDYLRLTSISDLYVLITQWRVCIDEGPLITSTLRYLHRLFSPTNWQRRRGATKLATKLAKELVDILYDDSFTAPVSGAAVVGGKPHTLSHDSAANTI